MDSTRELVEDGKTGVLFDLHNPDSAARKIETLLKDASQRESIADRAKQKTSHYSIETMAQRYMDLYTETIYAQQ
jgi:glycosyltransferase involved in cell wall biosynthesis